MLWLAGQVFLLCLVSFLAGAAITAFALRHKPAPAPEPAVPRQQDVAEGVTTARPTRNPGTDDAAAVQATELAEPGAASRD